MSKWKFYWAFYKSAMTVSYSCSLIFVLAAPVLSPDIIIQYDSFPVLLGYLFSLSNITIGPAFAIMYKELFRSGEYFFYYNRSISKIKLYVGYMV